MKRRMLVVVGLRVCVLLAVAGQASALQTTLEDPFPANTKVRLETRITGANPTGMYYWEVDGIHHVHRQWFWYRIGTTAESDLGSLTHYSSPLINDTNANGYDDELVAVYQDPAGLRISVTLRLRGGGTGSFQASMTETVVIENLTPSPMNVAFFQYTDFDLSGSLGDDHVELTGAALELAKQEDPGAIMTQTITGKLPTQAQVDVLDGANDQLVEMNDSSTTVLANIPGPAFGNTSYAYGWDLTLTPSGTANATASFQIKKKIDPQPAPVIPSGSPALYVILTLLLGGTALLTRRVRRA